MKTTTSKVVSSNEKSNDLLRKWCDLVASNGGSFSISSQYETGLCWHNIYVINWPDSIKVEALQ